MEPHQGGAYLREPFYGQLDGTVDAVRAYWDAYATGLEVPGATWGSREFFARIKLAHDVAYAGVNETLNLRRLKGLSLLELGCGVGLDTVEFARHGAQVTAIDRSPVCISLAKRLLAYHNLGATFDVCDAENLRYSNSSFDIVVARGLLMYTHDDTKVIREIVRVLKPGGQANVLLHNRFSWYVLLARLSGTNLFHDVLDPPINRLYSIRQAKTMLAQFSSYELFFDRFPSSAKTRTGTIARLYNTGFVPLMQLLPTSILRPIGFYIIAQATK